MTKVQSLFAGAQHCNLQCNRGGRSILRLQAWAACALVHRLSFQYCQSPSVCWQCLDSLGLRQHYVEPSTSWIHLSALFLDFSVCSDWPSRTILVALMVRPDLLGNWQPYQRHVHFLNSELHLGMHGFSSICCSLALMTKTARPGDLEARR